MSPSVITSDSLVEEVVSAHPKTVRVFMDHGLPCIVCGEPVWGTVEENAERYGIDLEALLKDLNSVVPGS